MITIKMVSGMNSKNNLKYLLFTFILILNLFTLNVNAENKTKPWIGIEFNELTEEFIKLNSLNLTPRKSLFVTNVVKKSPAHEGGIMPGDIILSLNNIEKNQKSLEYFLKNPPVQ